MIANYRSVRCWLQTVVRTEKRYHEIAADDVVVAAVAVAAALIAVVVDEAS